MTTRGTKPTKLELPPAPDPTADSKTEYAGKASAFAAALPGLSQFNSDTAAYVDAAATDAEAAAVGIEVARDAALAAQGAAESAAGAALWQPDTDYSAGQSVYSPLDFCTYRAQADVNSTDDPSTDDANWVIVGVSAAPTLPRILQTRGITPVDVCSYDTAHDSDGGRHHSGPVQLAIYADAGKITALNGDDPACPVWREWTYSGVTITCVAALNGQMIIGTTSGVIVQSIADTTSAGIRYSTGTSPAIVNDAVNDVAMTVLPDAPVDPATGLPVVTIDVATAGGVSRITDSGAVYDGAKTTAARSISYNERGDLVAVYSDGTAETTASASITADGWTGTPMGAASVPALKGAVSRVAYNARASASGLTLLAAADDMAAYVAHDYNTGWMVGDIKGCWLADTVAGDLVGSGEFVTNGGFDTDTSGWTARGDEVLSVEAGRLRVTFGPDESGAGATGAYQEISGLVVGQRYTLRCGARFKGTNGAVGVRVVSIIGGSPNAYLYGFSDAANEAVDFVANKTTMFVHVYAGYGTAGTYVEFDDISVQRATPDRSVNNNGLPVVGTITRAPVAPGADLMAYTGFSAANYLEQAYNPALDFGTGDFCVMGWMDIGSGSRCLVDFTNPSSRDSGGLTVVVSSSRQDVKSGGATFTKYVNAPAGMAHVAFLRRAGVAEFYVNGASLWTQSAASSVGGDTDAVFRVGLTTVDSGPANAIALLRISATAPTPAQIAKIHNDERALFQESAACTLYGASDAVTALAHDVSTGPLHAGTTAGRSVFDGLARVSNTTTPVSAAISAAGGLIVEG